MEKPALGDIVIVAVDPRQNNGSNEAPAVVVAIHEDETINVRALLDGDANLWITNLVVFDDRPEDEDDEDENVETVEKNVSGVPKVAYWNPSN